MTSPVRSVVLLGGGGHALVIAEALSAQGIRVAGHITPAPSPHHALSPYLGTDDVIPDQPDARSFMIALGSVDRHSTLIRKTVLGFPPEERVISVFHPGAQISGSAEFARGVFVAMGACVGVASQLGYGAIINTGAVVDHECTIGANTHVATGASVSGGVTVGQDCLIGTGASVRQGVTIGNRVVVGAGSVVVSDIPDFSTVMGVPARPV